MQQLSQVQGYLRSEQELTDTLRRRQSERHETSCLQMSSSTKVLPRSESRLRPPTPIRNSELVEQTVLKVETE